jgi:aconitate hydratase
MQTFSTASGKKGQLFSLPALAATFPGVSRLPVSIRIVLESVLRNCDGRRSPPSTWSSSRAGRPMPSAPMRSPSSWRAWCCRTSPACRCWPTWPRCATWPRRMGKDPKRIEPLVPVDLVVDHSVMIDHFGGKKALDLNMKLEFQRNRERYQFMKWGMQAFDTFGVVPPGFGIVHQVNLEYLARGVHKTRGVYYPDSLVGTDSHTTMINGIGVVGWGVGGIEAEAGMLGQPVYFLTPDVVGFELTGQLREGVTATDLVLTVTEILRKEKVVGKFVEFCGEGTRTLSLPDRATIANMAPEYGATMGFFPVDEKTIEYFQGTGRTKAEIEAFEAYFKAQKLFGVPLASDIDYTQLVKLDLGTVAPSLSGPKRPQDRIELGHVKRKFTELRQLFSAGRQRLQPAGREAGPAGDHGPDGIDSATATCSSPPSPAAPTPATRACCWPPACWRRRP